MSSDMTGPLSDKPNGITNHTQITNACFAAGELPNKTHIFILVICDIVSFLA
jgi:hypothetical protein